LLHPECRSVLILDAIRNAARSLRAPPPTIERAIEEALRARVSRSTPRLGRERATIVFDAGRGAAWTVQTDDDGVTLRRGKAGRATAVVTTDPDTLLDVLDGRLAGVSAFLDGSLAMRGNIALTLELDDLLPPRRRHPQAPSCRRVRAAGLESFYLEAGPADAPPVVLFHGLGATCASFLPTLVDLSRDFRVFAVDLPGFGESDKPLRPLHAAYQAEWAIALLDALGLRRAHLVGNSMGGRLALEVGLRAPGRVDRLVLLAPSLAWRRYRAAARVVRLLRPELAVMPLPVLHRLVVRVLRSMFARPERITAAAANAAADEFVRVFSTPRGRIAFFHAAREIPLEDPHGPSGFWNRLPSLGPPAFFIFGDKDWLVPRAFVRHVQRALPRARCEVFHDCGHVPQFEYPDRTHARVRAFLGE
jgi:pimeloyl-ACP methyl ester carboxylesterase